AMVQVKKSTAKIAAALVPSLYAAQAVPAQSPPAPAAQTPAVVPPGTQNPAQSPAAVPPVAQSGITQAPVILSGAIDNARIRMRDNRQYANQSAVELHKKFAISIACTVFILVGAP